MTVVMTRFSGRTFSTQGMRTVDSRVALRGPVPCTAEAVFAEAKAFLSSREARQMSASDLERNCTDGTKSWWASSCKRIATNAARRRPPVRPRCQRCRVPGAARARMPHGNHPPHSAGSAAGLRVARARRSASARCRTERAVGALWCLRVPPHDHRDRRAGTAVHVAAGHSSTRPRPRRGRTPVDEKEPHPGAPRAASTIPTPSPADPGRRRRQQQLHRARLEIQPAASALQPARLAGHGGPLPAGHVEVEPHRTPPVLRDQQELGGPPPRQLRHHPEVPAHHPYLTGLRVRAHLVRKTYKTGVKVKDAEMRELRITPNSVMPKWNYTIEPM